MRASSRLPPPRPLRADRPQRAPPGGEERMCPANAVRRAGRHRKDGIAGPISVRRGRRDFGNPAVRNRTGRASPRRPRPFEMSRKPTRRPPVRTICEFRFGVRPPLRTAGKRCAGKSCRKGPGKDAPEPAPRQCGRESRCCAKTRQRTPKPTEPRQVRRQELPEGTGKGCAGTRTAAMRPGKPMPRKDTTTHPETHRTETGAPPRQSLRAAEIRPVGRRRKRTRIAPPEGRKRTLRPAKRTALL